MEYYFLGFPGFGKKSRDKNTGQNDTGTRDPGTEPLLLTAHSLGKGSLEVRVSDVDLLTAHSLGKGSLEVLVSDVDLLTAVVETIPG